MYEQISEKHIRNYQCKIAVTFQMLLDLTMEV